MANERGPVYADQALAMLHDANPQRLPVTLIVGEHQEMVGMYCRVPQPLRSVVMSQFGAAYPDCRVQKLPENSVDPPLKFDVWSAELRLRPEFFPIKRYPQFEDALNASCADPLTGLLASVSRDSSARIKAQIEILAWPASPRRCRHAWHAVQQLASPFFRTHPRLAYFYIGLAASRSSLLRLVSPFVGMIARGRPMSDAQQLTTSPAKSHDREQDLQAASDKIGRHLFEARIRLLVFASPGSHREAKAKLHELAGAFGHFTAPRLAQFHLSRIRCRRNVRNRTPRHGFLLSSEELATLWHPPTRTVRAPTMSITLSRELEPPAVVPSQPGQPDVAELGRMKFRQRREPFGIRLEDRRRHLAVVGKTGMGKSTLLRRLVASDICAGRGAALIDPHGDLADTVIEAVPKHRTNDVVLFDAGDRGFPVAFNPLDCRRPDQRPLVASGVVSAFKKLYGDSWGPRLEHILRNALLATLDQPGASLVTVLRLLNDTGYRRKIVPRISDPVVRSFWQDEFSKWKVNFQAEAAAPIQNKIGQFLSHPVLRAIVAQPRSSIHLRDIMDNGRILIVNLSKGRIGEDASTLLGSLLVTELQLAAMSRADMPESQRSDFFCYVDEFQNFATQAFATILSEARKYRLSLTIANQYLAQMDEQTMEAEFGNVGSLLTFQVGARDAETIAEQLGGDVTPADLMNLPKYTAYIRLLIDGMPSRPFSMETVRLAPKQSDLRRAEIIRRTSRQRYAQPAASASKDIDRAFAVV